MALKLRPSRLAAHKPTQSYHLPRRRISSSSKLPPPPPSFARVQLPSRSFIALHGPEASRFLQGLVTSNIHPIVPAAPQVLYSAFLNAQGRLLNDVFIYTLPRSAPLLAHADAGVTTQDADDAPVYVIEASAEEAQSLASRLVKHKLRAKLTVRMLPTDALETHAAWSDAPDPATPAAPLPPPSPDYRQPLHVATDPRTPHLGLRILAPARHASPAAPAPIFDLVPPTGDPRHYTIRRYLRGVAEGPRELRREATLAHAANLDLLGAVDLRKGCYVGQELVTRTAHRGVVRRRVVPCRLFAGDGEEPPGSMAYEGRMEWEVPAGAEVKWVGGEHGEGGEAEVAGRRRARSEGTWLAGIGEVGLAEVKLESVVGLGPTGESIPGWRDSGGWGLEWEGAGKGEVRLKGFVPDWWRERMERVGRQESQGVQT